MDRHCCDGKCLQGRSCPYRSAVTPKDELPGPRRKSIEWEVWLIWGVASLLLALVFIELMLEVL